MDDHSSGDSFGKTRAVIATLVIALGLAGAFECLRCRIPYLIVAYSLPCLFLAISTVFSGTHPKRSAIIASVFFITMLLTHLTLLHSQANLGHSGTGVHLGLGMWIFFMPVLLLTIVAAGSHREKEVASRLS